MMIIENNSCCENKTNCSCNSNKTENRKFIMVDSKLNDQLSTEIKEFLDKRNNGECCPIKVIKSSVAYVKLTSEPPLKVLKFIDLLNKVNIGNSWAKTISESIIHEEIQSLPISDTEKRELWEMFPGTQKQDIHLQTKKEMIDYLLKKTFHLNQHTKVDPKLYYQKPEWDLEDCSFVEVQL
ncbi:MAG: hypothetical protein KKD01_19650 [Proteobacteria bacterium]|nr:hypothetical protein [Pseudomonadota bacterium]